MTNKLIYNESEPQLIFHDGENIGRIKLIDQSLNIEINGVTTTTFSDQRTNVNDLVLPTTSGSDNQILYVENNELKWKDELFSSKFISSEYTLSDALVKNFNIAHNMNSIPLDYNVVLKCKISEYGYAINEELKLWEYINDIPVSVSFTSTYMNLITEMCSNIRIKSKNDGSIVQPTLSRWVVVVKGWV